MSKRLVSLAMCMLMVACMMVAVSAATVGSVGENGGTIIYSNEFNSTDDLSSTRLRATWDPTAVASLDESNGYNASAGALKFTYKTSSASQQRICNILGATFKKGARYNVSFYAKASANLDMVMMGDFTAAPYIENGSAYKYAGYYPTITTEWKKVSYSFTIDEFATSASDLTPKGIDILNVSFLVNTLNFDENDILWMDDFCIEEMVDPTVTVNIVNGEKGTVKYNDNVLSDGSRFKVKFGSSPELGFAANFGYGAKVKVNGADVAVSNNNLSLANIKEDTVVSVSFESPAVVFNNSFESSADLGKFQTSANWSIASIAEGQGVSGNAGKFVFANPGNGQRMFNINDINWKRGATYTVSFDIKTSDENVDIQYLIYFDHLDDEGKANADQSAYYSLKNDWEHVSTTFTISDFIKSTSDLTSKGVDELTASILFNVHSAVVGQYILIDNFKVEEAAAPVITVNNGESGKVERVLASGSKTELAHDSKFCIAKGKNVTLKVTPDSGKVATVKLDGADLALNASNEVTFAANSDSVVSVTYSDNLIELGIEDGSTTTLLKNVGGVPTIYVYCKLNAYVTGENDKNFGIKLWKTDESENVVVLHSREADGEYSQSTPGQAFAIKAYGTAITSDTSYTVVPFVGDITESSEEKILNFEE